MRRLQNSVKTYAWGDALAIPRLLGVPPTGEPQAELWLGAHRSGPSKVDGRGLDALISENPTQMLGERSVAQFGPTLPFLLKVLAAAKPLSLQAHPSRAQAKAGLLRESHRIDAADAPTRSYRDDNHKPELLCALTPFQALCGFRTTSESVSLFRALGVPAPTLERQGLRAYFEAVMNASPEQQRALVAQVATACQTETTSYEAERNVGLKLARHYPGDVGLIGALLLNLVTLKPGEALYLPAGNLHAYLEGTGIEIMASSDNVLRGGLTPKHIDVAELIHVLDFSHGPAKVLRPVPTGRPGESVYETPAQDFELSDLQLAGDQRLTLERRGADIVLVVEGRVTATTPTHTLVLAQGESIFIDAGEGPLTLSGPGEAFRATVGRTVA